MFRPARNSRRYAGCGAGLCLDPRLLLSSTRPTITGEDSRTPMVRSTRLAVVPSSGAGRTLAGTSQEPGDSVDWPVRPNVLRWTGQRFGAPPPALQGLGWLRWGRAPPRNQAGGSLETAQLRILDPLEPSCRVQREVAEAFHVDGEAQERQPWEGARGRGKARGWRCTWGRALDSTLVARDRRSGVRSLA